jgi:hypothetical protein
MTAVRRMPLALILPPLSLALAPLAGCTTGYQVDVRNTTPQPVVVSLFQAQGGGQQVLVAPPRWIGPGDRDGLATNAVPQKWIVFVQADTPGNPGFPARLDLQPGLTVVNAVQDGEGQTGPLRLQTVQRP